MSKRLMILIGGVIAALIIVAVLLVIAVRRQGQTQVTTPQPQYKTTQVVSEIAVSPVAAYDNNSVWYFNDKGKLFSIKNDGTGLSEFPMPNLGGDQIKRVLWPKEGYDFIVAAGGKFKYYNHAEKIYLDLPANIRFLDWMPDGKRILYVWQSGDTQQLVMANSDGSGFTKVADLFWPDLAVRVSPDGKTALLWRLQIENDTNRIYRIDLQTKEITTLIGQGKNLGATWISANRFIFAQSSVEVHPKLYIYDLVNGVAVDLDINTDLNKIVADSDAKTLYAAVPNKDGSGDSFMKIDLGTYKKEIYFEPADRIVAKELFLVGSMIYYVSDINGSLYSVSPQ